MTTEAEVYFHPSSWNSSTPSSSLDLADDLHAANYELTLDSNMSHVSFTSPWNSSDPTFLSPALNYTAPEFSPEESDYTFSEVESPMLLMSICSCDDRSCIDPNYYHDSLFENVVKRNENERVIINSISPKELLSETEYSRGLSFQSSSSDNEKEGLDDPKDPSYMECPTEASNHKFSSHRDSRYFTVPSVSEIKPGSELWVNCHTKKRGGYHCDDKYIFTLAVDCINYMEKNRIYRPRDCLCSDPNCVYSLIGFVNKHGLSRHIKNVHTNMDVRSFCPLCLSLFFRADSLKRHNRDCHKSVKLSRFAHFEWLAKMDDQGQWIPFRNPDRPKMRKPRRSSGLKK